MSESMPDALERFVEAQAPVHDQALAELRAGRKRSHWMWFVFPQLKGLGTSAMAHRYGITSIAEARAYLADPLLGTRLRACSEAVLTHAGTDPRLIFGDIDAMKFRSSMTLFEAASDQPGLFTAALEAFYGGKRDPATLRLLADQAASP